MDGTLAEEPCTGWGEPAVDSRPQAVLEVLADSQDEAQEGAPKSTDSETLVPLASKCKDSVHAAPIVQAEDGSLAQRVHPRSLKKASGQKEPASSLLNPETAMAPSSARNPSLEKYFLSNHPLQIWLHRIQDVSRQKIRVLSNTVYSHAGL
jgi:hypothetical protein